MRVSARHTRRWCELPSSRRGIPNERRGSAKYASSARQTRRTNASWGDLRGTRAETKLTSTTRPASARTATRPNGAAMTASYAALGRAINATKRSERHARIIHARTTRFQPSFERSDLLAYTRGFAGQLTQVIQLGAAHVAFALHFDLGDARAVERKYALDSFAVRYLAHRERGVEAAIAPRDDHALESLETLALAFLHADVYRHGIARAELRNLLGHLTRFDFLQNLAHGSTPTRLSFRRSYTSLRSF